MKKNVATLLVLSVTLLGTVGCEQLTHVVWPTAVTCAGPLAADLVSQVEVILAAGGSATEMSQAALNALDALASTYGPEAIICVVEHIISSSLAPTGYAASGSMQAEAARAQNFLNSHHINVLSTP